MATKYNNKPIYKNVQALIKFFMRSDTVLKHLSLPEDPQQIIGKAAEDCYNALVLKKLESIPVGAIDNNKPTVRVDTLKRAGYKTIADLTKANYNSLITLNGIGHSNANYILNAAKNIKSQIEESTSIRLSIDDQTAETSRLVKAIYKVINFESLTNESKNLYDLSSDNISTALKNAKAAANPLKWFLASKSKKNEAKEAVALLATMAEGTYGLECNRLAKKRTNIENANFSECWNGFKNDTTRYNIYLEKYGYGGKQSDSGQYTGQHTKTPDERAPGGSSEVNSGQRAKPKKNTDIPNQRKTTEGVRRPHYNPERTGLPKELVEEIEKTEIKSSGLSCMLRGYQQFGVQYILHQEKVLLGDEMGLGKTVQAIAAIVSLYNIGETHFLVVCPAGVLVNWCREVRKFCSISCYQLHGSDSNFMFHKWIRLGGIAVTTYETLSKFIVPDSFNNIAFLCVDEAHYVKNPNAKRTQSVLRFLALSKRVLYMTGTPLENRVDEMAFLIKCINPAIGSMVKQYSSLTDAENFRKKVSPVYLRRTRDDVLAELPDIEYVNVWTALTEKEEKRYYETAIDKNFMSMRQVSWNIDNIHESSKAKSLQEICEDVKEDGRKIIVFSFFLNTIQQINKLMGNSCYGPISGSVKPAERQAIIDKFSNGPDGSILLAQIESAGIGLNIQAASVIILCEPQLKPSTENQAISRAYRMGQARKVLVYKLLSENSIDTRITELLQSKQQQFDAFADKSVAGDDSLKLSDSECSALMSAELARLSKQQPA